MDILLAHSLGLLWMSLGAARRLTPRLADQLLAAALLGWGNLVATGLLLSLAHQLGERFSAVDILIAGMGQFFRATLPEGALVDGYLERIAARPALARARAKDA